VISNRKKIPIFRIYSFIWGNFFPQEKGRPKPWTTFFSPSLRCSQFGNDPQFSLANFDYPQDKVRE
jgi:hypothetical protein